MQLGIRLWENWKIGLIRNGLLKDKESSAADFHRNLWNSPVRPIVNTPNPCACTPKKRSPECFESRCHSCESGARNGIVGRNRDHPSEKSAAWFVILNAASWRTSTVVNRITGSRTQLLKGSSVAA